MKIYSIHTKQETKIVICENIDEIKTMFTQEEFELADIRPLDNSCFKYFPIAKREAIKQMRDLYFSHCVDGATMPSGEYCLVVNMKPHDLFEWFVNRMVEFWVYNLDNEKINTPTLFQTNKIKQLEGRIKQLASEKNSLQERLNYLIKESNEEKNKIEVVKRRAASIKEAVENYLSNFTEQSKKELILKLRAY